MTTQHISAEEAIAAARAQAFTVSDEYPDAGRRLVHSFTVGGIMLGADWDLEQLIAELNRAQEIAWFDDFIGHELAVKTHDGRFLKFEVKRPEAVSA